MDVPVTIPLRKAESVLSSSLGLTFSNHRRTDMFLDGIVAFLDQTHRLCQLLAGKSEVLSVFESITQRRKGSIKLVEGILCR